MSIAERVEPAQDRSPQLQRDKLAQLRQQGLYALAGVSAVVLLLAGYVVKRDFFDMTPSPVFDCYQILQNDKKQTIRLDKTNGRIDVIENGVFVGDLHPKIYAWEKLNDGSKVTVTLEYHDGKAYCAIKVEKISPTVEQKGARQRGWMSFIGSGSSPEQEPWSSTRPSSADADGSERTPRTAART